MDTERETRDLMNVKSFSQLPFTHPGKEKVGPIRLFGKLFGGTAEADKDTKTFESSRRKFVCNYCCRNFSTSQALGGHQNTHKRERQHAKRSHFQSAPDHYALINYSRFGSAPAHPTAYYGSSSYGRLCNYNHHVSYSGHQPQQINGGGLPSWRISTAHNTSSSTCPPSLSSGGGSRSGFEYESTGSMQDHVSLDLHL
ncbi:hypothetical protein ACS0TY_034483 [Phlomoides rotata]